MFTGIIQYVGMVQSVETMPSGKRLTIDVGPLSAGLRVGDSVAVSGACLTAAELRGSTARFDVVTETLARTTLGLLRGNSPVNLERSLRLDSGLDGHLVQGHVDGLAEVESIQRGGDFRIQFRASRELTDQMVSKGSITVDGVSLTLTEVEPGGFGVALIPTTLSSTTLGRLQRASKVNIETDVIGKYVLKYLRELSRSAGGGLSLQKLRDAGFA